MSEESHQLLGHSEFTISELARNKKLATKDWFYITLNQKVTGHVYLEVDRVLKSD